MEVAIGVIGLSIQVIDSSLKVKKLIDRYRSAEDDLRDLGNEIDISVAICSDIKNRSQADTSNSKLNGRLVKLGPAILASIDGTTEEIARMFAKLATDAKTKSLEIPLQVAFLRKQGAIKILSQKLSRDLHSLQSLLTVDMWSKVEAIHLYITQPKNDTTGPAIVHPKQDGQRQLLDQSTESSATMRTKKTPPTVVKTVVERQQVTKHGVLRFYWTQGRTIVSRTIKGSPETRDLTNTDETYTYAIGHDKIPYRIEMVWRFGSFSGLRPALNIPHIIEFSSTIYQAFDMGSTECTDLIRLFYNFQVTLTEFQVLLETRQITPHSRVGNRSLFEHAILSLRPDICRFLIKLAPAIALETEPPQEAQIANTFVPWPGYGDWIGEPQIEVLEICFCSRVEAYPLEEFKLHASNASSIRFLDYCYLRFRPYMSEMWNAFMASTWSYTIGVFLSKAAYKNTLDEQNLWIRFLGRLLKDGVDVHATATYGDKEQSAFSRITMKDGPASKTLRIWLGLLQACSVDVSNYLARERRQFRELGRRRYEERYAQWTQECSMDYVAGFEVPCWRRWVDPASPAFEVLDEFRGLGESPYLRDRRGGIGKDIDWDNTDHLNWPFYWSPAIQTRAMNDDKFKDDYMREGRPAWFRFVDETQRLIDQRFERRQRKKLYKAGILKRTKKGRTIPGAWVDDDW